ncbi:MAG: DNA gyrase/topoisomerase IV subunit A, partial [Paludibacteraceae bacterium]|nr:DNA gyrase/topoisomerase IV subunit A [Paludibacteraceae bacterium]
LSHLTDYTITWFENLQKKYGDKYPRKTEIRNFANINVKTVIESNEKLYINRAEGFIGMGMKKDEFLCNCSPLDDILVFYKDGRYKIVKVADKLFIGTDILHVAVFKKNDVRTIYNVVYRDGKNGYYFIKRFAVTGMTRDKEYDLTQGKPNSKVIYFSVNPNGEAETIKVLLKPTLRLRNTKLIKDFKSIEVKGRASRGNILSKHEIKSIILDKKGGSTLGGRQVWYDPDVLRLNYDGLGKYLGEFAEDDKILVINKKGGYYLTSFDLTAHFDDDVLVIEKYDANKVWSLAMWNEELGFYYGKRFLIDETTKVQNMLGEDENSRIVVLSDREEATFLIHFQDNKRPEETVVMSEFIDVKSTQAKGKRLTTYPVESIEDITPEPIEEELPQEELESETPEPQENTDGQLNLFDND